MVDRVDIRGRQLGGSTPPPSAASKREPQDKSAPGLGAHFRVHEGGAQANEVRPPPPPHLPHEATKPVTPRFN